MTEPLGPPPIDPLPDAAWGRVERGVWARLDAGDGAAPRARRWWWLAAPLAAPAVIALVVGLAARAPGVTDEPARVVSGAAPSRVSFGDAHVELDAATALVLGHDGAAPTVWLEHGAAWFTVAPRRAPAFVVRAGDATVRVVGTRFRVARAGEQIGVEVEHGLVEVRFRGRRASVGADQRWTSEAPAEVMQIALAPPAPLPSTPAPIAPPAPTLTPPAPTPPAPTPPAPTAPTPPAPTAPTRVHPAPPIAPHPAAAPDRARADYEALVALEPRDPERALTGYLALARGASRWADPALFAAARLATDRNDRRAAALLALYLQRFPAGANATDARQLLARLTKGDSR